MKSSVTREMPHRPVPAIPPVKPGRNRRFVLFTFLGSWIGIAWIALTGALLSMFFETLRFLFPNVLSEPSAKFKAGLASEYGEGEVCLRFKEKGTWIVRYQGIIYALSTTCTHLGCIPNWLEDAKKFKCPCHGSGYYITGVNFEGPAPRPLERWAIHLDPDGQMVVDKSKHFQKELGQWNDPESFIKV